MFGSPRNDQSVPNDETITGDNDEPVKDCHRKKDSEVGRKETSCPSWKDTILRLSDTDVNSGDLLKVNHHGLIYIHRLKDLLTFHPLYRTMSLVDASRPKYNGRNPHGRELTGVGSKRHASDGRAS